VAFLSPLQNEESMKPLRAPTAPVMIVVSKKR
jgi:hypothetical protein